MRAREQQRVLELYDVPASIAVRDLERGDFHVVDVGDQLARVRDNVIDLLERDVDDVVFRVVADADERRPVALDLTAKVERRDLDFRITVLENAR